MKKKAPEFVYSANAHGIWRFRVIRETKKYFILEPQFSETRNLNPYARYPRNGRVDKRGAHLTPEGAVEEFVRGQQQFIANKKATICGLEEEIVRHREEITAAKLLHEPRDAMVPVDPKRKIKL